MALGLVFLWEQGRLCLSDNEQNMRTVAVETDEHLFSDC